MLDFSISKLAVLALLALLVLGPEKLPKVAAQLGRWVGKARVMARNLRAQLEQEVSYEELLREKQKAEAELKAVQESAVAHPPSSSAASSASPPPPTTPVDPNIAPPHIDSGNPTPPGSGS